MARRVLSAALAVWLAVAAPAWADSKQVIVTSGTTWTVPVDWSPAGASVEAIGGGANGGGAYAKKTTGLAAIHPGQAVAIQIGAGAVYNGVAGDTCFNGCTFLKANGANQATGGTVANSVGDVLYHGGNGNGGVNGNIGGGGAAGPHGAGNDGQVNTTFGGSGDAGFGGAGSNSSHQSGFDGTEWGTAGSGGGGGTCCGSGAVGNGGSYGGGGAWDTITTSGTGAQGVLVITYTPRRRTSSGAF
jgi:hypothetical protein